MKVVLTAPERIRLVVVKVETNQPGLYGWGYLTQRPLTVKTAVEEYRGLSHRQDPANIEDIGTVLFSSYWRNGLLNNAISGGTWPVGH